MDGVDTTTAMERIVAFVNTRDVDNGTDELNSPADLRTWLSAQTLLDESDATAKPADLEHAKALREALRSALLAHDTAATHPGAATADEVLASVPLQLVIGGAGGVTLTAAGTGVAGALACLVAPIPAAVADGTWDRAKACPQDNCQWAFLDLSRNRSRRWCSMEVCGNREKSRSFRHRQRADD